MWAIGGSAGTHWKARNMTAAILRHCLRLAARRWPADIREDMYREWTAELHSIADQPDRSAAGRAIDQFRFAFSLATSPPAPDENRVPRGWRELLPQLGTRLQPTAILFLLGIGFGAFLSSAAELAGVLLPAILGGTRFLIAAVLAAVFAAWAGNRIGARMPLTPRPRGRIGRAFAVAVAPLSFGAGLVVCQTALESLAGGPAIDSPLWTTLWIVLMVPLLWIAVRLARRGRPILARCVGGIGGLVVLQVLAVPVVWSRQLEPLGLPFDLRIIMEWLPSTVLRAVAPSGNVTGFTRLLPTLLWATAFIVWYTTRSCRSVARPVAASGRVSAPARVSSPAVTRFGLAALAAAVLSWAVAIAVANPVSEEFITLAGDYRFLQWAVELRQAAILLASLALALSLVGCGRPFLPAVLLGAVLFGADAYLDAVNRVGLPGLAGALTAAAIAVAGARWLGRTLLISPPQDLSTRRSYMLIAFLAASCAPVLLLQSTWSPTTIDGYLEATTPLVFPAGTVVVVGVLGAVAGVSALAARRRPLTGKAAVMVVAFPVAVLVAMAAFSGAPVRDWPLLGAVTCLPFAMFLAAVVWWERSNRQGRAILVWLGLHLAAFAAVIPLLYLDLILADGFTPLLLSAAGHDFSPDDFAFMLGAIMMHTVLAVVAARILIPAGKPVTVTRQSPAPVPRLSGA